MRHFDDIIKNLDILYKDTESLSFAFDEKLSVFWCNRELEILKYDFIDEDGNFSVEKLNINKKAFLDDVDEHLVVSFSQYVDMFNKVNLNICKNTNIKQPFYIVNISREFSHEQEYKLVRENTSAKIFSKFFRDIISSNDIILNIVGNILDEDPTREKDAYMEKLIKNNFSMLRQISNITLLENLYEDITMDDFMYVNFKDYLTNTLKAIRMVINEPNIPFSYTIENTDVMCYFSPEKMTHVITNIVSNSFLFNQDGNKLNIKFSTTKKSIILKFTDKGTGIKPEFLPLIRQKFFAYRDDETIPSLGLGLSIVEKIISIHGGSMIIESNYGEGTSIVISIPIIKNTKTKRQGTEILSAHQKGYIKDKFSPLYVNLSDFIDFRI